jgi:hypothetical protein
MSVTVAPTAATPAGEKIGDAVCVLAELVATQLHCGDQLLDPTPQLHCWWGPCARVLIANSPALPSNPRTHVSRSCTHCHLSFPSHTCSCHGRLPLLFPLLVPLPASLQGKQLPAEAIYLRCQINYALPPPTATSHVQLPSMCTVYHCCVLQPSPHCHHCILCTNVSCSQARLPAHLLSKQTTGQHRCCACHAQ